MQINSSSNASLISPHRCFSDPSAYPFIFTCFDSHNTNTILIAFIITNLFLLIPLYVLVLWTGFRRWWHQSTAGTMSHLDVITYHMVTLEIVVFLGMTIYCISMYTCSVETTMAGYYLLFFCYPGQTFFHCLTCMERYLAVVHPITYLGLKKGSGVRIRNISIGCVLLLCLGITGLIALNFPDFPIYPFVSLLALCLIVVSFCSMSTLRVLICLGLGKLGRDRERIDQSKKRAFNTIMAIFGTLTLRFCALIFSNFMFTQMTGRDIVKCVILMSAFWFCLPSSLVLPLLFLHRAGTLACFSRNLNQSEK